MTRYGIDAGTAIRLVRDGWALPAEDRLVAPTLLRSQVLSEVYRAERRGEMDDAQARAVLDGITTMKVRLLGDRVSRATARRIARDLDWDDTTDAEYVAVALLQADTFVTLDADLARRVEGVVTTTTYDAMTRGG